MKSAPEPGSTWGSAPAERFNWRDLFRVLGLALDVGKWKVGLLPVVFGVFVCLGSFEIATRLLEWWPALDDHPFVRDYLPCLLMFAGAAILYLCVALAVSGVTYQVRGEVLDGQHRSFSDVLEFWGRHLGTLIRVPVWLLVIIGALLAVLSPESVTIVPQVATKRRSCSATSQSIESSKSPLLSAGFRESHDIGRCACSERPVAKRTPTCRTRTIHPARLP